MSVFWSAPLALIGLTLIALPIAVHLLARQEIRTLPFPSLRFLRQTQLAAFRRRSIQDALLLIGRVAIVALAAAAIAGPVFETASRTAGHANRVSRAVVIRETVAPEVVRRIIGDAFRSETIQRDTVADAFADAVRWLEQQPRSSREIVVAGPLRRGDIGPGDLAVIPETIGVRFEQTAIDGAGDVAIAILARRNGALSRIDQATTLTADATRVAEGVGSLVPADLVTIASAPRDAVLADAALRAALGAGVPWHDFTKRVVVVWEGGDADGARGAQGAQGAQIIRMEVPSPSSSAAGAVHAALAKIGRARPIEPLTIPQTQLDSWTRRPGLPSIDAPIADEGDRRWVWAAALVLLGLEWWLRRARAETASIESSAEVRVA